MRFFLLTTLVLGILCMTAIRIIHERNRATNIGFELQSAIAELSKERESLHQLRIQRAELLDPKHLRPKAREIGLRPASPDEVVPMNVGGRHGP